MLGYAHRVRGVPLQELCLEHLVPLLTAAQLDGLAQQAQADLWYEQQLCVEGWLETYFQWIKQANNSLSPRTKCAKLLGLQRVGHFLYRRQVRRKRDYDSIPMMITLAELISQVTQEIQKWKRTKTTVSDMARKWPDVVEGETALTTVRHLVVEPLRLQTLPRRKNKAFREPQAIAKSLQHYIKWAFTTDLPPRRQFVYRTALIALSCPIQRPDNVPLDGCYFPLPPDVLRTKNYDGTLADNYLCKVYAHKDRVYPGGMWILQIAADKMNDIYGIYPMEIPNRYFDDGTCFYESLERYLCGLWLPGRFQDRHTYTWWDAQLQGQTGHWVTKGWMEFEPKEAFEAEERRQGTLWRWGYLFPLPETGYADPADHGTSFGGSFERTSYHLLGKRITPHLTRSFWATWAFQVKLEDHEVASLAYAMGHSVRTLREIYERCTPEEKSRPIYEAINRHLFPQLEPQPEPILPPVMDTLRLVEALRQLSLEDRQKVIRLADAS